MFHSLIVHLYCLTYELTREENTYIEKVEDGGMRKRWKVCEIRKMPSASSSYHHLQLSQCEYFLPSLVSRLDTFL